MRSYKGKLLSIALEKNKTTPKEHFGKVKLKMLAIVFQCLATLLAST